MRRVRRFQIAQYTLFGGQICQRYTILREGQGMATHDKRTMEAVPANCLSDMRSLAQQACVIGIDEGQFVIPDTVEFCEEMANWGKTIIVAALDGTFQRKPFGNILNLVPLAESVVKLNAVCMICYKEAAYTKRLGGRERRTVPIFGHDLTSCFLSLPRPQVEVIGGADMYHARCRKCYGGLMDVVEKENSAPHRDETPPHAMTGKLLDNATAPRKLFATLHL
ncbi:hypothetical protein J4Q44_G00289960 [Coregonus suidteri]|uniref:Thymidine kinase n=1 Tax=Coregonus suidteri TaxID=861788 RepID=A0AAN8KZW3_9TELE